ncbi:MAG: ABC transporter permease, partial [Dehalococcoidia bacterium]
SEGGISHQIIDGMVTEEGGELKPGEPKITQVEDYDKARKAVEDEKLPGFLVFPEDFTEGVQMGYGTELEVVVNPEETYTAAALRGVASSIASRVGAQQVAANAAIGLLVEEGISTSGEVPDIGQTVAQLFTGEASTVGKPPISMKTMKVGEVKEENPANFVIPGYLVMFVFFTAALSAESIVRERRRNTLERLLACSVQRESIIGGIFAGTAAKGLVQILIFWGAGILIFNIDMGLSPAGVILLSILMVIMSSAFGVMLATLTTTERSASGIGVLTALVLAPLGGCWWPSFLYPEWLQTIAKVTPHAWATSGFNKLMVFGAEFSSAVPEMIALVVFAILFGVIAVWRFRTSAV